MKGYTLAEALFLQRVLKSHQQIRGITLFIDQSLCESHVIIKSSMSCPLFNLNKYIVVRKVQSEQVVVYDLTEDVSTVGCLGEYLSPRKR